MSNICAQCIGSCKSYEANAVLFACYRLRCLLDDALVRYWSHGHCSFHFDVVTLSKASCSRACAFITKQYNLVAGKEL